jgi:hypothetical protein
VVALVGEEDGRVIAESARTDGSGTFSIEAPTGRYALVVDAPEGAFRSTEPLSVLAGSNRPLALALRTAGPDYQATGSGLGGPTLGPWAKWLIVGVIGVAALYAIDEIGKDEKPASGF